MAEVIDIEVFKEKLMHNELDASMAVGNEIAFNFLFTLEPKGTDNTAILYSIWNTLSIQLMLRGFKAAELRKDISSNSNLAKNIENSQ